MRNQFFLTLLICVFISSCGEKTKTQEKQADTSSNLSLVRTDSTVTFTLGEHSDSDMTAALSFSENGKLHLCLYQRNTNSFEIYDFAQKKLVKTISMSRDGADGVNGVGNYAVINSDNFIIAEENKKNILLVNSSGKIQKKVTLPDNIPPFAESGYVLPLGNYHNLMQYAPASNTLWLHAQSGNYLEKDYYKQKLLLRIENLFEADMKTEWTGEFPESYKINGIFAGGHEFSLFQTANKIGIAFCASAQLCFVDKKNNKHEFLTSSYPEESIFYPLYGQGSGVPSDFTLHMKQEIAHRITAPAFANTAISPNGKLIFRVFKEKADFKKADGTVTEMQEVQHHLLCYDLQMNLLAQIPLKTNTAEHYFFAAADDGVWLFNTPEDKEDELSFVFVKLANQ